MKLVLITLLVGACLTQVEWPTATSTKVISNPIRIKPRQIFDGFKENGGKWVRYERGSSRMGDCTKVEGGTDDAVFILEAKATLKNVILGPNSIKHVYCIDDGCIIENVWWEDACENAVTLDFNPRTDYGRFFIRGCGFRNGRGNVIQHNSAGDAIIQNVYIENSKQFYSSCENCKDRYQGKRTALLNKVTASNVEILAGYNVNYGDVVRLYDVEFLGGHICKKFEGRNDGKEATALGHTCDSTSFKSCLCN